MPKCVYCGKMYEVPQGLTFIKKDGTILYFCSSKCRKNMFMKRRKVNWVLKKQKVKSSE
ncbi:MAG: 50S ribosomal protein L24e [Nanoarchaeota archaeon]|nr:50S ribosomal protein L24e [Nanoarchaeota archaeon]